MTITSTSTKEDDMTITMTITSSSTIKLRGETALHLHHFAVGGPLLVLHTPACTVNVHLTPEQAQALSDALRPAEAPAMPLLQLGTRVVGKPARVPFDREASGVVAEVGPSGSPLPYRVLFDGRRRPLWCSAADVRVLEGEGV